MPTLTACCFADGGIWGAEYEHTMELINVQLITPEKHKLGQRPPSEIAKARIRLIVESLFANLKRQMRLEDHLAKTKPGLAQRIAQRLLALTLGIYLNILNGRPPRALAAYDGRSTHIKPLVVSRPVVVGVLRPHRLIAPCPASMSLSTRTSIA